MGCEELYMSSSSWLGSYEATPGGYSEMTTEVIIEDGYGNGQLDSYK